MMRPTLLLTCLAGLTPFAEIRAEPADLPNILFIAVDDLNDWTGGLGGHPQAQTPHLDRLAARGTLFANAHCQAPICGPSRASLFTGLYPSTTGLYLQVADERIREAGPAAASVFLTEYLEQYGYKTMGAGKLLHLGAGAGLLQEYGGHKDFGPYAPERFHYESEQTSTDWGAYPERDEQMPDHHVATYAVEKLGQPHDRPFFLGVGFNRPHVPWYVPAKWFEPFPLESIQLPPYLANDQADLPEISRRIHEITVTPTTPWLIEQGYWEEMTQAYLACVAFVDHQIGRVLEALEASPYAGNTVVVLWSDHGYHLGEKDIVAKMTVWEESTRVPLIIAGPGLARGAVCRRPVGLIDLYPTLLDLAGLPPNRMNDGRSLVPLLRDTEAHWPWPALTFWGQGNTAVRSEDYRYVRYEDGSEELYDHRSDPHEWHNLAMEEESWRIKSALRHFIPDHQEPLSPVSGLTWNAYWTEKTEAAKEDGNGKTGP